MGSNIAGNPGGCERLLRFTIPSPPSVNNLFANVAGKGRVRSERYRVWANAAGWAMKTDGIKSRSWNTIAEPVSVEIEVNSQLDIDNSSKAVLDLLVDMAVLVDDRQVHELRIRRCGLPRIAIVTVRPLVPDESLRLVPRRMAEESAAP